MRLSSQAGFSILVQLLAFYDVYLKQDGGNDFENLLLVIVYSVSIAMLMLRIKKLVESCNKNFFRMLWIINFSSQSALY
ncbi:hypothetical protein T4B_1796 [Trichinella pseudospiralis]|uniref:Uncharacterized protein n=1 Tax=Trichinella pseudospiralis TaxID=6337 RepID=A0A0V1IE72_TRIPS|nr:hypothetical protein T4B_1796 [Trichinella pseudospiralis]